MDSIEFVTPNNVVVYGSPWCPHCKEAKNTLADKRIGFVDVDVTQYPPIQTWLQVNLELCSGTLYEIYAVI